MAAILATASLVAGEPAEVKIVADWKIAVASKTAAGKTVRAELDVPALDIVTVKNEKYPKLPDFNPKLWAAWKKGVALRGVKAMECTSKGALDPDSLVVASGEGAGASRFDRGKDYEADLD